MCAAIYVISYRHLPFLMPLFNLFDAFLLTLISLSGGAARHFFFCARRASRAAARKRSFRAVHVVPSNSTEPKYHFTAGAKVKCGFCVLIHRSKNFTPCPAFPC